MIQCYVDLSGKDGTDAFMTAGAYLASEERWQDFRKAWGKALRAAGAFTFHATDFFNGYGEFARWDVRGERHIRFAKRFTNLITKYTACGFAVGVHLPSYHEVMDPVHAMLRTPHGRVTPETFCLMNCLSQAVHGTQTALGWVRMQATVFIEDGPGMGEAVEYLNFLRRVGAANDWTQAYVSFNIVPKKVRPLQAADLLAHEAWRRINQVVTPNGREVRKSLRALLRYENIEIVYATRDVLSRHVPRVQAFLRTNPAYTTAAPP